MTSLNGWSFHPFPAFAPTLYPNTAFWNATNPSKNLTYQIQLSWPFSWSSSPNLTTTSNRTALTLYVLDGNALGTTAAEAFKRRPPPAPSQPEGLVVSVGYPLTDSVYAISQRAIDFTPPLPPPQTPPSGADDFLAFISGTLRPWVRKRVFPSVTFRRDALYGHSFGGLFVVYALISQPEAFDTFLAASPSLWWNRGYILDEVSNRLGSLAGSATPVGLWPTANQSRPAVVISYGDLEQFPVRRRKETEAEFQARKRTIMTRFNSSMTVNCHELFDRIKGSGKMRDVVLKEYAGQDHNSVAASAITDGLEYFIDW